MSDTGSVLPDPAVISVASCYKLCFWTFFSLFLTLWKVNKVGRLGSVISLSYLNCKIF